MPLEELLSMYGYGERKSPISERTSDPSNVPEESCSLISISDENSTSQITPVACDSANSLNSFSMQSQHLRSSQPFTHMNNQNLESDSEESESDDDYSAPEEDWRRTIQVGTDYQAQVPEGLYHYDDAPAYENEDRLLWDPSLIDDAELERYLSLAQQLNVEEAESNDGITSYSPHGSHVRDDEQALYLLHQCGHNVEEALRRKRMGVNLPAIYDNMTSWSEEECLAFEAGLRIYGKDFYLIQMNKV